MPASVCSRDCYARFLCLFCFFFNATATTEIYTLSLHDALPIFLLLAAGVAAPAGAAPKKTDFDPTLPYFVNLSRVVRSEEHTSELQSRGHLVCRLLLEKKKKTKN